MRFDFFDVVIVSCTPCLKKQSKSFCHNFVKFLPTSIIFGTRMAKTIDIGLCKVHSFSTSLIFVNALPCETLMPTLFHNIKLFSPVNVLTTKLSMQQTEM